MDMAILMRPRIMNDHDTNNDNNIIHIIETDAVKAKYTVYNIYIFL